MLGSLAGCVSAFMAAWAPKEAEFFCLADLAKLESDSDEISTYRTPRCRSDSRWLMVASSS